MKDNIKRYNHISSELHLHSVYGCTILRAGVGDIQWLVYAAKDFPHITLVCV